MSDAYLKYRQHLQKVADVNYSGAVLAWDQETYMAQGSADTRGRQLSTLSGIGHQLFTDKAFGDLLQQLMQDASLTAREKKNVELTLDDYKKQTCLSTGFVEKLSNVISKSFNAWQKARKENDFKSFAPFIKVLAALKKEEALQMGYANAYEGMLDTHERGITIQSLDTLFEEVKAKLVPFVKRIAGAQQVDDSFMYRHFPKDAQWNFSLGLLKNIGFDFSIGRQDLSMHPFTTSFGSRDVRVTTRVNENDLSEIIWSTIHEGGHALYEQGLPEADYGLPGAEAAGLGLHESQSRLWENNVGRGKHFWIAHYPQLQSMFIEQLSGVNTDAFYKAMNKVEPSLIRTNADELTYHFHVMIRYEIEKALMFDQVSVDELPALWNAKYKEYLGIDVPSDSQGILQDVHWSHGSFGYFPTYSIGSFYAAQLYHAAGQQVQGLGASLEQGNCAPLLTWLRSNIQQYGRQYTSEELCAKATGEGLNFAYFMNYATQKYSQIYNL